MKKPVACSTILKIVISICFLVSSSLTSIGQDRVEVYGPAPRPYDYPWLIPSYNSFGISYYPSATINNQGNGDQNTGMIAFDFRRLYFNPEHYSPISIGCSFEGFFTPAPANNYNVQYYGGSVNFCLFLLPRKLFASPISLTAGLIGGIGFADAQNNLSPYDPNYIYSTDWFFNLEGTIGIVMVLDKTSRQGISIEAGYNFDQYDAPLNSYLRPNYFVRFAYWFGRGRIIN